MHMNVLLILYNVILLTSFKHVLSQLPSKKKAVAYKPDLPLVACATCTSLAYVVYDFVGQMHKDVENANLQRAKIKSKRSKDHKRLDENSLSEVLEGVCDPESVHGEWMRHLDVKEITADIPEKDKKDKDKGKEFKKLAFEWHENIGHCGVECRTMALSCHNLLHEELDVDELQSILYRYSLSRDETLDRMCMKMSNRCRLTKAFAVGSHKRTDEPFTEMTEKDLEIEQLMARMASMGMGGVSAYGRDDLDAMSQRFEDGYEDSPEDGYDGDAFGTPGVHEGLL